MHTILLNNKLVYVYVYVATSTWGFILQAWMPVHNSCNHIKRVSQPAYTLQVACYSFPGLLVRIRPITKRYGTKYGKKEKSRTVITLMKYSTGIERVSYYVTVTGYSRKRFSNH